MSISIMAVRHREPISHELWKWKWFIYFCFGNDSSVVSEIIRISMSKVLSDTNVSNLFRIELIFIWAIIAIIWGYFKHVFINYIIAVFCCYFWGMNFIIFPLSLGSNLKLISRIQNRKVSARMEKPTKFKCKLSQYKCLWIMLSSVI